MEIAIESKNIINDMLGNIPNEKLTDLLKILREPLIKISDSHIEKSLFFSWKKAGISELLFKREEKKWNVLSLMELTILSIVEILWKRDINDGVIKTIVEQLLDGEDLKNAINERIEGVNSGDYKAFSDKILKNDLIGYLVMQKMLNPHLPSFCNIEAFIIGVLKLKKPFGLLIFEDGKIDFFITSFLTENFGGRFLNDIFSKTFLNVSIKSLLDNLVKVGEDKASSKETNLPALLIKKGYDAATIKELFSDNESVFYSEENLPTDCQIEKTLQTQPNQDLIIKMRGGKKTSIRRIIINQKKEKE